MKLEIRGRDRRALLILGLAAIVYVIVSFGLLPAFDTLGLESSSAGDKEQLLSKYRRALIRKGTYAELLDQVRKNIAADEPLFIRGDNPTLAAVELQGIVEGAAQKMNVELSQRNVSAARKKDDFFNEIAMTVSLEGTPAQVFGFIAELRNSPKFISIRNAQLAPADVLHALPEKGAYRKITRGTLTITAPLPAPPGGNGVARMRKLLILNLVLVGLIAAAAVRFSNDWRMFEATHQPVTIQPEGEPLRKLPSAAPTNTAAIDWTEIPTRHPFSWDRNDTPFLEAAAPPRPPGPRPRLFGTLALGSQRMAMVGTGQPNNRNSRPMKVGETIDGWTITQILDKSIVIAANSIEESVIMHDPAAQLPRDTARTAPAPVPSVVSVAPAAPAPVPLISSPAPSADGQPRQRRRITQQTPFGVREIEIEE